MYRAKRVIWLGLFAAVLGAAVVMAAAQQGLTDAQRVLAARTLLAPLMTRVSATGATNLRHIDTRLNTLLGQLLTPDGVVDPLPDPDPDPEPEPNVINVPAGGNLQEALNTAPAGAVIQLQAGAEYVGSFTVPMKACEPVTRLTTASAGLTPGTRVTPAFRGRLAVVRSGGVAAALRFAEGTCGWDISGLDLLPNNLGQHEVVEVGRAWDTKTLEGLPRNIRLTHLLMDFPGPQKRGIGCNGINVTIEDSYLTGLWVSGQDSQAIACWNTPGPVTIRNNHLEAGSEPILFGGADPGITNVVPADLLVERNTITRPLTWRGDSTKQVKNLFEVKAGLRITVRHNLMFHHWQAAQPGWAIVLTPRSQGGRCTECRIEDVLIEHNAILDVSAGFNITHTDDVNPSGVTKNIVIRDNYVRIDHRVWGGNGRFMQIGGAPEGIVVEYNTVEQTGNQFLGAVDAGAMPGFRFVGNLVRLSGAYGIFTRGLDGNNYAHGLRWKEKMPDGVIEQNAIVDWRGNAASRANLPGNLFVTTEQGTITDGYGEGAVAGYGRRRVP